MPNPSRIEDLALQIGQNVATLSKHYRETGRPFPSFAASGPVDVRGPSDDSEHARQAALTQCRELLDLLQGPQMCVRPCWNLTSLHAIYVFDIAKQVPLDGTIPFEDLAVRCHLALLDLRRILRFAMVYHRCFCEPTEGVVAHTAASRQIAVNPQVHDGIGLMFDDFWPSFAHTVDALQVWPDDQAPNHTGWALAHHCSDQTIFQYLAQHPHRERRFGAAMQFFSTTIPGFDPALLLAANPFAYLGPGSTLVDVGGSTGYVAAMIQDRVPSLRCVVQDLASTIDAHLASGRADPRLVFQKQDFFMPNQEHGADVYLFRWILHDWPDAEVQRILRALVPALKPGARVLINDSIGSGQSGSIPEFAERVERELDMIMLSAFNGYEREPCDWHRVFHDADARFRNVTITYIPGAVLHLIEAIWTG